MAEARLAVIVDATGARREVKLTTEDLIKLANSGKVADTALRQIGNPQTVTQMRNVTQAVEVQQRAVTGAVPGLNKLQNQLGNIAVALSGIPGPVGRVASTLGQFAIGGAITVGVLAGLAAVVFAYEKLTEKSREAREELEKHLDVLRQIKREQDLGITGEAGAATTAGKARLGVLRGDMGNVNRLLNTAVETGQVEYANVLAKRRTALIKEYVELEALVSAGEKRVGEILADAAKDLAKPMEDLIRQAEQFGQARKDSLNEWMSGQDPIAMGLDATRQQVEEAKEWKKVIGDIGDLTTPDYSILSPQFLDSVAQNIDKVIKRFEDLTEAEKRAMAVKLGGVAGVMSAAGIPGSGILGGAIGGIPGGATGIAFGAAQGFVSEIINVGRSSQQAAEQLRQLREGLESFIDSQKEALGIISGLEARLGSLKREFADARDVVMAIATAGGPTVQKLDEARVALERLGTLEAQRTAQIVRQQAEIVRLMAADNEVLRLRVLGRDDEAEMLARQIANQREINDLIESGASKREIALTREQQALEDMLAQAQKIQERIASLSATISGLQDFRNSLLLSPDLSPTARLAEARRQYEEILGVAQGSDIAAAQDAAGRLPAAARTLLDLAREVFGSGSGFQDIRESILGDTAELINIFEHERTVQEEMLEQLRRIAVATETTAGVVVNHGPIGSLPAMPSPNGGGGGSSGTGGDGSATQIASLVAAGANATVGAIRASNGEVAEEVRRLRSSLDAAMARITR